jgi:uroporphyrin-III C-methyltransferase
MSKIFLVGAGPGDPELLTVKAYRLLQQADVVLHDGLVSPEVLELAPKDAVVINVGKRCGNRRVSQEDIHALMVAFASPEQTIVRLKSGDPMLFGRAAEEMEALEEAQVDYEVVPGVTAALAAAAQAGISLTDRRFCSHVIFTTGHTCAGKEKPDWRGMVRSDTTVAIYMPGSDYQALARSLTSAGLAAETPCVLISQIGSSSQQVHRSSLNRVAELPPLSAPALFLAGNAVGGRGRARLDVESDLVPQFVTESSDF